MKFKSIAALMVSVIGVATMANAQQKTDEGVGSTQLGKYEYDSYCAACHGPTGKGDGFYSLMLERKIKVANLSELSKNNGGVFPFSRVYETIDGRREIQAHGTREMPIWGRSFSNEGVRLNPSYDPEAYTRAKILALIEYVYGMQAK